MFAINSISNLDYDNNVDCVRGTGKLMKYAMFRALAKPLRRQPVMKELKKFVTRARSQCIAPVYWIRSANWMSDSAKDELISKLEKTKFEFASPDELLGGKMLSNVYDANERM